MDMDKVQKQMDPGFHLFLCIGHARAEALNTEQLAFWGEHGPGCSCDLNKHVAITIKPDGTVGFAVHKTADLDIWRAWIKPLVGEEFFNEMNNDPKNPWGSDFNKQPVAAIVDEPDWFKSLNLDILETE